MLRLSRLCRVAAVSVLGGLLMAVPTGVAAPRLVGSVEATDCANLGVTIVLRGPQLDRARALLPAGFTLARPATLLVETSTCASATIAGAGAETSARGRFFLSEAALSVRPPRKITARQLPDLVTENIFMLSQLDTDPELSAFKAAAGYRTELTEIELQLGNRAALRRAATASAGGTLAPSSATAFLSPGLLPRGWRVRNPGVVYKLWTKNAAGRFVVTTNANLQITQPALGWGTVRAAPGTLLHGLLGREQGSGIAFSGGATRFVNDTYVFDD